MTRVSPSRGDNLGRVLVRPADDFEQCAEDPVLEMAAFDALPEPLRAAIREAAYKHNASRVLELLQDGEAPARILYRLRAADETLRARLQREVAPNPLKNPGMFLR